MAVKKGGGLKRTPVGTGGAMAKKGGSTKGRASAKTAKKPKTMTAAQKRMDARLDKMEPKEPAKRGAKKRGR